MKNNEKIVNLDIKLEEVRDYPQPNTYVKISVEDVLAELDNYEITKGIKDVLQVYSLSDVDPKENYVLGKVIENKLVDNKLYCKVHFTNIQFESERISLLIRDTKLQVVIPKMYKKNTEILVSTIDFNQKVIDLALDFSIIIGQTSSIDTTSLVDEVDWDSQKEDKVKMSEAFIPTINSINPKTKNNILEKMFDIAFGTNGPLEYDFEDETKARPEISDSAFDSDYHCMIDIETLGTNDDCVISEISLIRFNPKTAEVFESIKVNMSIQDSLDEGFTISESTVFDFWFNQPKEVFERVNTDKQNRVSVEEGLEMIYDFLDSFSSYTYMWGKGPSFDLSKLKYHFLQFGYKELPWRFFEERCVRTINAIDTELVKSIEFEGDKHDSYHDCLHQINQISSVINKYNL